MFSKLIIASCVDFTTWSIIMYLIIQLETMHKCSMERLNIFGHWLNKWCLHWIVLLKHTSWDSYLSIWTPWILLAVVAAAAVVSRSSNYCWYKCTPYFLPLNSDQFRSKEHKTKKQQPQQQWTIIDVFMAITAFRCLLLSLADVLLLLLFFWFCFNDASFS